MTTEFSPALVLGGLWASLTGDRNLVPHLAKPPKEADWATVKELLESRQVQPVIDRRYSLSEVPEALRRLGEGRARGKVVITMPGKA